jgi:hypothetical protein
MLYPRPRPLGRYISKGDGPWINATVKHLAMSPPCGCGPDMALAGRPRVQGPARAADGVASPGRQTGEGAWTRREGLGECETSSLGRRYFESIPPIVFYHSFDIHKTEPHLAQKPCLRPGVAASSQHASESLASRRCQPRLPAYQRCQGACHGSESPADSEMPASGCHWQ